MEIISKQELENLKEQIETASTKKELFDICKNSDLLSSFLIFVKNSKIADSKSLLLQIVNDKLQIFAVQEELQKAKKSKTNNKSNKRIVSEKENSSLFSVFDLLFNKSKYLANEDYLNSENVKSVFEIDKVKNFKADLYRRLKRFATLSEKEEKTEKETEEFQTLTSYLLDVFNCNSSLQLITVLNNISSDVIKEAAQNLANERVKAYNYLSFEAYVKVLKTFTVALDSNNLTELEKVLESFLEFVENSQNPENLENLPEKSGKNSENS